MWLLFKALEAAALFKPEIREGDRRNGSGHCGEKLPGEMG